MAGKTEIEKYYNYKKDCNYKAIMEKAENKEKDNSKNKILKIVATILITVIGTMGVVVAATQIYNSYAKKNDDINLYGLFKYSAIEQLDAIEKGISYSELIGMNYDEENFMHYKVITDEESYKRYKEKVKELPESKEINFKKNFLILIVSETLPYSFFERNLTISGITTEDTTMNVILELKEKLDEGKPISMYVIADKSLLRENLKIKIDTSKLKIKVDKPIDKLPVDYSEEEAIKDGCVIIKAVRDPKTDRVEGKITSENKYALDELIENAEKGIESYVRLYLRRRKEWLQIYDVQYKNGMFIINSGDAGKPETFRVDICKYIVKEKRWNNQYAYRKKMDNTDNMDKSGITMFEIGE